MTALALAAMRGVEVDIVLPERSNHPVMDWAVGAEIGPLLQAGCRIWRNPPPFEHSKLMTIDGAWCLIGSTNWDTRSFRLNFELNVEVYDSALATKTRPADGNKARPALHRARNSPSARCRPGCAMPLPGTAAAVSVGLVQRFPECRTSYGAHARPLTPALFRGEREKEGARYKKSPSPLVGEGWVRGRAT